MQTYDYFNSFIMHSFPRPIKGVEQIGEEILFILLDDGTCSVFNFIQMKVLNEQKYPELSYGTHVSKFTVRNDKSGETRDLIMTQHKLEEKTYNIVLLQKNFLTDYTGFMKLQPNEEVFSYKLNYVQERNVLTNSCFLYAPNRKDSLIEKINLLDGKPICQYQFFEDKLVDTISCIKKVVIETEEKTYNLLLQAYEGLFFNIIELCEETQEMKQILPKTKIIESKDELPYIFDFQISISVNNQTKDIILTIYIGSSVQDLNVLKFNLNSKQIISQKNINIKYIAEQIGISNIQIDKKSLYLTTVDKQIKIISKQKLQEVCSFQFHNNSINGILLIKDKTKQENSEEGKTKYIISISEDCKLAIIDLNKLRKKK